MKFGQYLWTERIELPVIERFSVKRSFLCILHLLSNHQPTQLLIVSHRPTYFKNKPCLSSEKTQFQNINFF